ncbi:MAG: ABC transporter ATP-binding protein/permease [Lachnospiraceae bacterium]|nr:ABC transporter ATP-binding protein/permease [Lachnospiraceae bacterium]
MAEQPRRRRHRGPGAPVEKAKDFKGTLKKLIEYLNQYHLGIIIVMIFTVGSTLFNIIGPKILGKATTEIYKGLVAKITGSGGIDFDRIGQIALILVGLYAISALFGYIQGYIMAGISQKVSYNLRKELSEKINRLPMNYYDKTTHGEVLSRITNDVDMLGTGLNQTLHQLIQSTATIIGVFVMMMSISPLMTLIALVTLPISAVLVMFVIKNSQKYFKAQQEYLGHVNGQIEEVFGGHNIVKLFNKEETILKEFEQKNDILYQSAWKSQFLSGLMHPLMTFVGNLGYVAVVIVGGYLSIRGTIEVGDIQSFIQYVRQFTQPVNQLAQVSNMLQSTMAAAERVFEFLDEGEEEQESFMHEVLEDPITGQERNVTIDDLDGSVEFWHVDFGYTRDKRIIHDFNAKVKPGQKIAIVGPTGAGKTTIVKLLMRFYDIDNGAIRLNDWDVQGFDRSELREAFGMVLQDTWLFKGTIMENIRYGRLDATDEEVIAAAEAAHAHHFIQTLEHGYQTELNEEATNISQGQKQLLTIARAILADNKILILDEATSSVDTRTETLIQEAMDNLMKGRTSFVIAHRLSTIKNSDVILVLKDGDIIEQGNHEELMKAHGFYHDLYNSQFEESA